LMRHAVFWVGLVCPNMRIRDDEPALTNEHDSARGSGRLNGFAREGERISPAWHCDIRVSEARVGRVKKKKVEEKGEKGCSSHSLDCKYLWAVSRGLCLQLNQLAVGLG
jgi:hypothetical protein